MAADCMVCGIHLSCPTSSSCTLICSNDCSLCITKCGNSLDLVEETPWLLKAEKLKFTSNNVEPGFLAEYLGRLLGRTLKPAAHASEPVNVSELAGTVEEILDHVGLEYA